MQTAEKLPESENLSLVLKLCLWALLILPLSAGADVPKIAIIIDDMGNTERIGEQLIDLPYSLTFSFLPYRQWTISQAQRAHSSGKEVMLHAPMESLHHAPLGKGGILSGMSRRHLISALQSQLKSVPYVVGVNNHMGSKLTQNRQMMRWFMAELSDYPLFFVDSRTTAKTVAATVSLAYQIPTLERDVFLDHIATPMAIEAQFERLIDIARTKGYALAIGHPRPDTLAVLNHRLPELEHRKVQLVSVSRLLQSAHEIFPSSLQLVRSPPPIEEVILTESRIEDP